MSEKPRLKWLNGKRSTKMLHAKLIPKDVLLECKGSGSLKLSMLQVKWEGGYMKQEAIQYSFEEKNKKHQEGNSFPSAMKVDAKGSFLGIEIMHGILFLLHRQKKNSPLTVIPGRSKSLTDVNLEPSSTSQNEISKIPRAPFRGDQ